MRDAAAETICARLCLLTRAAWRKGLPKPLDRTQVRNLIDRGALHGLVLREGTSVPPMQLEQARALLTRASEIYDLQKSYSAQGYRAMLPEDRNWPTPLLALGEQMPLFLFALGNAGLLHGRHIAVAGSRRIQDSTRDEARRVGQALAREGLTMVCGGAEGVDSAAQEGLLSAGGKLILVPSIPSEEQLEKPLLQKALHDGRLLMLCDTLPDDVFSAERALGRNHIIYALGSAALVLAARKGMGGSWKGARASLQNGYAPVFVPEESEMKGIVALRELGARTFSLDAEKTLSEQMLLL